MSDLKEQINSYFKPKPKKIDFESLTHLVEETIGELGESFKLTESERKKGSAGKKVYNLVLGQFTAPSEQAGKFGTSERIRFQKYISRNIQGTTLTEKIASINAVAAGQYDETAPISEILAALGALKMLQQTLDDFNESTAGFLFEAFLSALLQGTQVTDKVGGTLPIEDCMFFVNPKTGDPGQPVSLKLLSPGTEIDGSLENLLAFFRRPDIAAVAEEKGIEYIVATKTKGDRLDVYSFNISPSTFFHWINEKFFNWRRLPAAMEEVLATSETTTQGIEGGDLMEATRDMNDPEIIKQNALKWAQIVRDHRLPMMGLPSTTEFDFDWSGGEGNWKKVIPLVPTGAKQAVEVANIMLSDLGEQRFEEFGGWFGKEGGNVENLRISDELIAQFLQDEDPAAMTEAAKHIAVIGRARRDAYLNAIRSWGLDTNEGAVHVYRYKAILDPKTGQLSSAKATQRLQDLLSEGAEGVIKWSLVLEKIRLKPQFHLRPTHVRGRGTVYGTVKLGKRSLMSSMNKYSERLEELCIPIYESMQVLTDNINGFYFQNRPGDALKAADEAQVLSKHTDALAEQVGEKQ